LFSFGKTATKQISETATHLKDVIEKNVKNFTSSSY
jgi:hypothetical protein